MIVLYSTTIIAALAWIDKAVRQSWLATAGHGLASCARAQARIVFNPLAVLLLKHGFIPGNAWEDSISARRRCN